jgi:hypothetical protein
MDEIQDMTPEPRRSKKEESAYSLPPTPRSLNERNLVAVSERTSRLSSAKEPLLGKDRKPAFNSESSAEHCTAKSLSGFKSCNICSLDNQVGSLTCTACSHVLDLQLVPDHWKCQKAACKGSQYINSGDAGRCGVCGSLK